MGVWSTGSFSVMMDEPGADIERTHFLPISVIVITHNEEKNIRECLDSLMQVDYPRNRLEILVVDSSSDATPEIVREYRDVRLISAEKGFSQQRNAGIKAASFDIIAFLDADGMVAKNWPRTVHKAFQNPEIAAVGGNGYPPPGTKYIDLCVACIGHPAGGAIGFDANVTRSEKGIEFVPGCNCAFRREALEEAGGFDPRFYDGGEDIQISRRLRDQGYFLDYVPELTFFHKPRSLFKEYIRWNIGVGITKYNLTRPSWFRLILQHSFPLWPLLFLITLLVLIPRYEVIGILIAFSWGLFLLLLYKKTKPFPLLIKRRKKIGIDLFSIMTLVPALVYLRQVCMNVGQIKKYLKLRSSSPPGE